MGAVAKRGIERRLDYEHVAPAAISAGGRMPAAQSMASLYEASRRGRWRVLARVGIPIQE